MNDEERYRRGANARRKILGDAWVDRADANRNSFNAEWQNFITRCAWGEVWTRPHFDERTRRVLVIGTMMAIGRWEEFRMHLRAALVEGGFSPDDIKEIILQQAIYCGVPVGNHAFRQAGKVLEELEKSTEHCSAYEPERTLATVSLRERLPSPCRAELVRRGPGLLAEKAGEVGWIREGEIVGV